MPVRDSIGMALGHDLTRVVAGRFKGPAFRRGHVVRPEDVPELLSMGREYVYVYEPEAGEVHEDDAACRLAQALAGPGLKVTPPQEGRANLVAEGPGLLRVYRPVVEAVNREGDAAVATLHDGQPVQSGEMVAGVKIIPLAVREEWLAQLERRLAPLGPAAEVKPWRQVRIGAIITGNELATGRVADAFAPALKGKLSAFEQELERVLYLPDDAKAIARAIQQMVTEGLQMVLVCGGMSVDPDDTTPAGIRRTGARVVTRGTPIFPGAMFMFAYLDTVPLLGLPACVMHDPATVFDLVLPRLLAGETLSREDILSRAVGGLCRRCPECHFPVCPFGK
ncbi:MAG: molybdopterin-binding protein [Clostridia bacterium]|nr:molybdopterin-binding protein [Clostridia bacterium]MDH7572953.1 molybdopterin-binding protein [Clostridia bacterium]